MAVTFPPLLKERTPNWETEKTFENVLGEAPRQDDKCLAVGSFLQKKSPNVWDLGPSVDPNLPQASLESLPSEPIVTLPYKVSTNGHTKDLVLVSRINNTAPLQSRHVPRTKAEILESCRMFVWRNSEWHPVSGRQQRQITANVRHGKTSFQVVDGTFSWTVQQKLDGWEQVSPAGTRRPLQFVATLHPVGALIDPSRVQSAASASPDSEQKLPEKADDVSFEDIQAEWHRIMDDRPYMTPRDLVKGWRSEGMSIEEKEHVAHVASDMFQRADYGAHLQVDLIDWIHFRLLEGQAPSQHASHQLNQMLAGWDREIPKRLLEVFINTCEEKSARLTASQMKCAARTWLCHTSNETLPAEYVDHLKKLMSEESQFEEGEPITYYEFLHYMLGRRRSVVELYYYDLTHGSAMWWSPILLGQQMQSIWHCGVVVHGKEYRYGGNIFESKPGRTAFGKPTKVERVGETCRSRQEILSFISRRLAYLFAIDSYQVFSNNSNHFCDALLMFLLNEHISLEVKAQPELIMNSHTAKLLSGWLPWLRGDQPDNTQTKVLMQDEWKRVCKGCMVTYEYEDGWTCMARVLNVYETACDLQWLDLRDGTFRAQRGVPWTCVQAPPSSDSKLTLALPQKKL
mmetsp:Transcript_162432/g.296476  ORF Transcript_162432/g.296476 Transcript_162432/m.296476 type:complete len:628 (-) Transcript_162432:184-2067(-)